MQSENIIKKNVYPSGKETCPKYNKESICRKYLSISIFSNLSVNWPKELFNKKKESHALNTYGARVYVQMRVNKDLSKILVR